MSNPFNRVNIVKVTKVKEAKITPNENAKWKWMCDKCAHNMNNNSTETSGNTITYPRTNERTKERMNEQMEKRNPERKDTKNDHFNSHSFAVSCSVFMCCCCFPLFWFLFQNSLFSLNDGYNCYSHCSNPISENVGRRWLYERLWLFSLCFHA